MVKDESEFSKNVWDEDWDKKIQELLKEPEGFLSEATLERIKDIDQRINAVREAVRKTIGMAEIMDRYHLDPILGWILEVAGLPIIGDIPTTAASLYIVWEAQKAGLPAHKICHMLFNVGIDFAVDLIPILGNIADFFIRVNKKNLEIIKKYADELIEKRENITEGLE